MRIIYPIALIASVSVISTITPTRQAEAQAWSTMACEAGTGWRKCGIKSSSCGFNMLDSNIYPYSQQIPEPTQQFVRFTGNLVLTQNTATATAPTSGNFYYFYPGGAQRTSAFYPSTAISFSGYPLELVPDNIPGNQSDYDNPYVHSVQEHARFANGTNYKMMYVNLTGMEFEDNGERFQVGELAYVTWSWEWFMMSATYFSICKI